MIEAAFLGSEEDGGELLRPLRELGPIADTFAMAPAARCCTSCTRTRATPCPGPARPRCSATSTPTAIDSLVELVGPGSGSPFLSVELRHLGGALARPAPGAGALATLNGAFAMFAVGIAMDEAVAAALHAHGERLLTALAAHDAAAT